MRPYTKRAWLGLPRGKVFEWMEIFYWRNQSATLLFLRMVCVWGTLPLRRCWSLEVQMIYEEERAKGISHSEEWSNENFRVIFPCTSHSTQQLRFSSFSSFFSGNVGERVSERIICVFSRWWRKKKNEKSSSLINFPHIVCRFETRSIFVIVVVIWRSRGKADRQEKSKRERKSVRASRSALTVVSE